ncbi:MAG: efflux RND transporter periplasmic adaptor subunit [Lentisphaeria bacterium]
MKTFISLLIGGVLGAAVVYGLLRLAPTTAAPPTGDAPVAESAPVPAKPLWSCGMHPQVIQDHPGNCPICGMKLTPKRQPPPPAPGEARGADANAIRIDPTTTQNMNLRTGAVTQGSLRRVIRTVGSVEFDETALADVTTKFKGWVEKLYVDSTGKQVHQGEPLFEIYSPELYSAQVEYLLALKQGEGGANLRNSALTKLKFFDISDDQIAELEKTRQAKKTLKVLAPRDGIVMEKDVVEGQMADAGMKLFRIADLGTVWVLGQLYEQDLPYVKLGQEAVVTLPHLPDRAFRGRVTYVYPSVDDKTRTVKVRMEFHNPGYQLKPGMFATVELRSELAKDALLVPDMAVLRSGDTATVFVVRPDGGFEARTVTLGPRAEGGFYQVRNGLKAGEKIVVSGQFMLDSESQLREALAKIGTKNGKDGKTEVTEKTEEAASATDEAENDGDDEAAPVAAATVYVCPMPEHLSVSYQMPGKCPLCGMALVPVTADTLARLQPDQEKVAYYTCPMPEHASVHEAKAGKCPLCGMTLVPVGR